MHYLKNNRFGRKFHLVLRQLVIPPNGANLSTLHVPNAWAPKCYHKGEIDKKDDTLL